MACAFGSFGALPSSRVFPGALLERCWAGEKGNSSYCHQVPSQKSCAGGKRLGVDRRGGRAEALLGSWPLEEMVTPLCFAQSVCPLGRSTASFFDV